MLIIDANNLAGKLGLLDVRDFDKQLIELLKNFIGDKKKDVVLVFDSLDPMGDKYKDGSITVIYTPRDNYYNSADDKILEIIKERSSECILVTDDIDIINKAKELSLEKGIKIIIERASDFSEKIGLFFDKEEVGDEKSLGEKEEEELNKELLNIWK